MVAPAAMMMMAVDADTDADGTDMGADNIRARSAGSQQGKRKDRSEKRFHERKSLFDDGDAAAPAWMAKRPE